MVKNADSVKKTEEKQSQTPATIDRTLADAVLKKVQIFTANKDLRLPPDYSPENALKSAWLILLETKDSNKKPVLEVCTKESIANSLLKMVLLGLNPLKSQCDFITYGDKLSCDPSYFGNIALARRHGGVKDIFATIIYEGDELKYSITNGYKKIDSHIQEFGNIDINKIKGAYATVYFEDKEGKEPYVEIMTMTQIRQAWMMGAMKGNSPAHKNFSDEMSGKTVISRAAKRFINSSDDNILGIESGDSQMASSKQQIEQGANKEEIRMSDAEIISESPKENKKSETAQTEASDQAKNESEIKDLSELGKENKAKPGF